MSRITRRKFLTALGLGGAGAAAAVVAGGGTPEQAQSSPATATDGKSRGYQVTAHVRHYYRTTRV